MSARPIHVAFHSCWFTLEGVCCCCEEIWQKSMLPLRRNFVKENKGVWRRRIYRKYASCRWLRTQDLNLRADVVLSLSRGPPGQRFPETEYWVSAIFVGTSGIPPKIIYRSVKSYKLSKGFSLRYICVYMHKKIWKLQAHEDVHGHMPDHNNKA